MILYKNCKLLKFLVQICYMHSLLAYQLKIYSKACYSGSELQCSQNVQLGITQSAYILVDSNSEPVTINFGTLQISTLGITRSTP